MKTKLITDKMTDDEILRQATLVDEMSYDCEIGTFGGFACGDNSPDKFRVSAVLRDFVSLRKAYGEIKDAFEKCKDGMTVPEDAPSLYLDSERVWARREGRGEMTTTSESEAK